MAERIIRNSVKCAGCGDEIESTHRHDFKWCSCKNIAVDGGKAYLRRVGGERAGWEDTSIIEQNPSMTDPEHPEFGTGYA